MLELRDQLVNERRIRPEDMHIMANIFLPKDPLGKVRQIDHLVLTRTGIYVIDSNLVSGHIYHGITDQQFSDFPVLGQVFETLDLNPNKEQTLLLEKQPNNKTAAFHSYTNEVKEVDNTTEELQRQLELKYTPTPIIYFHPNEVSEATISNYSQDPNIKVLVGENNFNTSLINLYFMVDSNIVWKTLRELWMKLKSLTVITQRCILCSAFYTKKVVISMVKENFEVKNPATGEVIETIKNNTEEDINSKIEQAHDAFQTYKKKPAHERSALLYKWYELILENKEEIALIMTKESGKPLKEALGEVKYATDYILWFAEEAKRTYGRTIPEHVDNKRLIVTSCTCRRCSKYNTLELPSSNDD